MDAIPPQRYYLEKVLRDMGRYIGLAYYLEKVLRDMGRCIGLAS